MFKPFNVVLDVSNRSMNDMFEVSTNDLNTIRLDIKVKEGMNAFDLTGKIVRLAIQKPDKNVVFQTGGVTNGPEGLCEIILSRQANVVDGRHEAELMIFEGEEAVAVTTKFFYNVKKALLNDDAVKSTSDFPAINQAIEAGQKLVGIDIDVVADAGAAVQGIQAQVDQLVIEGDSSVEAAQMRVDAEGVTHVTAKARADSDYNKVNANFDELNILATKFGASASAADNAPFINAALAKLKANGGGTLLIPEGYFKIKSPIVVSGVGVYLKAASLYKTRIIADSTFVGAELIRLDQDQVTFNKGVGLEGFYIDCNNVNAHGVTVVNAYDQSGLKHVEVRNTNDNYINFNFIQPDTTKLGQTLLLENCIGEKFGNTSTKPVYFFEKYQEVNLVGCKAFPNKANSTPGNGSLRLGDGFYFKDCRGFTLTGCSSAFADNAIVIHAETRNAAGFTIVGQTNEQITGYAIKTVNPNSRSIETITCLPIRAEGPSGKFLLDKTTLCTLYTLAASVEITSGSSQNTVFTTNTNNVTNSGIGNTVLGFANYNTTGFSVMELLRILKASSPAMYLGVDSQTVDKRARLSYNASETTDTGISLDKKIAGAYVKLLELTESNIAFNDATGSPHASFKPGPANGYTGMLLTYRGDSVTQYRQVQVGAMDSAGTGFRTLRVPN